MRKLLATLFAVTLVAAACDSGDSDGDSEERVFELAADVGPDAFTPSVVTDEQTCDKDELMEELESRPDAHREWAEVLDVDEDEVADYIDTLESEVLDVDTAVINHGLADGQAYPRSSVLEAGTAVLVDPEKGTPVTRCKCGNPLLPPEDGEPPAETTTTTEPEQETTTTTEPENGEPPLNGEPPPCEPWPECEDGEPPPENGEPPPENGEPPGEPTEPTFDP